ncbi:sugar O-acetyltransferase [[Clostridium] hylemonae]|uniref:Acetyltransferase n=1 Tax=[Clostridium] hylemonae DSM 15053 TaxID=553973 RepID=C0C4W8_9FIRM|nr:sugar O-acetyltransferase [[Clostridium] hylemonae]EEG72736.1 bacterial transferase hexapeptide repeat protein [[Clostridium] hylemonae DSM 15053]QEK16152.1 Maltose O-acetyltransferase [[Clostridium] hylemonae DSM 15053]
MTEKELMLSGQLYIAKDEELTEEFMRAKRLTRLFNNTTEEEAEYRAQLLKELFGKTGENLYIEPSFRCDYGKNISIGDNFYANYDCIIVDVCSVSIGDNVFWGPRVCVYTAGHPIDAGIRNTQLEFGSKVSIGNNVWIGGSTVINPGVSIGDNVVIGSGAVVTKDIPSGVIAAGCPCKVLREINEDDKRYWEEQAKKYRENKRTE